MIDSTFETAELIRAAVKSVEGMRVYDDPAATVTTPAAIVGAPQLTLEGISSLPTRATFPVAVMVDNNKSSVNKLLKLVPEVIEAIRDQVPDAEILETITPAVIQIGNVDLPGYMIFVEV